MSVTLDVFLNEDELPTRDRWQEAIHELGIDLQLDAFNSRVHRGYLPVTYQGRRTGFEYDFSPIDVEAFGGDPPEVGGRTHIVTFKLHGTEDVFDAALYAAAALTKIANGLFSDPQTDGDDAEGGEVFELIERRKAEEADRRRLAAAEDAHITDRRCPSCGAPCPWYRKTCKACGVAQR
jgi:hypothetical protein